LLTARALTIRSADGTRDRFFNDGRPEQADFIIGENAPPYDLNAATAKPGAGTLAPTGRERCRCSRMQLEHDPEKS
jgi:hypothetical protein